MYFYAHEYFACMHVYAPHVYLTPVEAKRRCWILWNQSFGASLAVRGVLGIEARSLKEKSLLLDAQPPFQPQFNISIENQ